MVKAKKRQNGPSSRQKSRTKRFSTRRKHQEPRRSRVSKSPRSQIPLRAGRSSQPAPEPKPSRFRIDHLTTDGIELSYLEDLFVHRGDQVTELIENTESHRVASLIGAPTGWGKTVLIAKVKHELRKILEKRLKVAELPTLNTDAAAFVRDVARGWRVMVWNGSVTENLTELRRRLNPDNLNLLIIDEASDIRLLPEQEKGKLGTALRSLIDLRGKDGRKLCSVIVAGMSEDSNGIELLNELGKASAALRERLRPGKINLPPIDEPKLVRDYVNKYAGFAGIPQEHFEQSAINAILEESAGGSPRKINQIIYRIVKCLPDDGELPTIDRELVNRAIGKAPKLKEESALGGLRNRERRTLKFINEKYPNGVKVTVLAPELRDIGIITTRGPDGDPRPATSNICRALENKGLLDREESGKTHTVKLSERAQRLLAKI